MTTSGTVRPHQTVTAHHFTVDVEEYFQVSAFENVTTRAAWSGFQSRVESSMEVILDLLAEHGARGTFFTLGWLAERKPHMVRRVAAAGHEIASHGMDHRRVTACTPDEFRASVRDSKRLLEDLAGADVVGFRAPSFSIVPGREWALEILLEEGYGYDSSLFPIHRPGYGYGTAPRDAHWMNLRNGRIAEFPPATLRCLGVNLPAAGGAYLRLFPEALIHRALRGCEARGVSGTFYVHPWEVDPAQPRLGVGVATRVRHYGGLNRTLPRMRSLLSRFRFTTTMVETYRAMSADIAAGTVAAGA